MPQLWILVIVQAEQTDTSNRGQNYDLLHTREFHDLRTLDSEMGSVNKRKRVEQSEDRQHRDSHGGKRYTCDPQKWSSLASSFLLDPLYKRELSSEFVGKHDCRGGRNRINVGNLIPTEVHEHQLDEYPEHQ